MSGKIVSQFNEVFASFLEQVSPVIGTKYQNKFQFYISMDSTSGIETFLVHALPVRDKIMSRDETYFTSPENANRDQSSRDNSVLSEILKMQSVYAKLNEESKKNMWDIFQALLLLGEEYIKVTRFKNL
jgi:hypothetical protein